MLIPFETTVTEDMLEVKDAYKSIAESKLVIKWWVNVNRSDRGIIYMSPELDWVSGTIDIIETMRIEQPDLTVRHSFEDWEIKLEDASDDLPYIDMVDVDVARKQLTIVI